MKKKLILEKQGTNEIQIYEKKNNKMLRIPVKLTRNPFGYTKFPIGCLIY